MNAPAELPGLSLKDAKLFREQCYIDGEWSGNGKTFPVVNPATGAQLGTVPKLGADETRRASSAPIFGTVPSGAPVAGLVTGKVFPLLVHSPSM